MKRHPLEVRIASLRSRVRRLVALHGLSWVLVGVLAAVLAAGLADWGIHLSREVRLMALAAIVGLGSWLLVRFVISPLVVRFRDLDIAMRIEKRWPGLNDRLASTVEFLRLDRLEGVREDLFGSRALRSATIEQAMRETEAIDFREVIDPRPVRRAWISAALAVAVAATLLYAVPQTSRIAMARLFRPFGTTEWPKQTHLTIQKAPAKVARGDEFLLEVGIGPDERMPTSATATYRFKDGEQQQVALRPDTNRVFHGRIEAVDRPFTFTVTAGDDQTRPRSVAVVPAPAVSTLSLRVVPPDYTGMLTRAMASGIAQVEAVVGSRIEVAALANKPIARASLRTTGDTPTRTAASVGGANHRNLKATFDVKETGTYLFELRDTEGFRSRESEAARFEVRAQTDETPRVVIEEPINDRDVTVDATVPIRIVTDDDFGLAAVRLLYRTSSDSSEPTQEIVMPLWAVEDGVKDAKHQAVDYLWDLAPLNLPPGSVITFHADARDLDNLKGPNLGRSRELRLRIITKEEMQRQLEATRREIRDDIARILAMENQAIQPVEDAERTLEQTNQLEEQAHQNLVNAGVIQHQVTDQINNPAEGLGRKIDRFLQDLKNLKIDNPDAETQMRQMQQGVERMRQNNLGPAEQDLSRAAKALEPSNRNAKPEQEDGEPAQADQADRTNAPAGANQQGNQPDQAASKPAEAGKGQESSQASGNNPEQPSEGKPEENAENRPQEQQESEGGEEGRQALADAAENQKAISDELNQMLDSLKEFETYRSALQDAKNLLHQQEEALKTSADAASKPELMGKTPDQLTPQQKADLANQKARQEELAQKVQDFQNKIDEMSDRIGESDPLGADALKQAAQESRQNGTASKMSKAAEQLEQNQLGSARANQQQARQDLQNLVDTLQNRRETELARLIKELKATEQQLGDLKNRQQQNRDKTAQAAGMQDDEKRKQELQNLAKEQQQLEQELRERLQKLKKLRAELASKAGSMAASSMNKASQSQMDDDAEDAEENQDEAMEHLTNLIDDVQQVREEAEERLAMEQLTRLADDLRAVKQRQDKLVEETADYDAKRQEGGDRLSPAQRASVRTLARVESALREEANGLGERLENAPVFSLMLKGAADRMQQAAERLQGMQTDAETQRQEKLASTRFEQLIEALKPDKPLPGQNPGGGGGGDPGGGGGPPPGGGDPITTAAQIKLLKVLQLELNDQTEALDELRRRNKTLTEQQEADMARLQDDQQRIEDLARDLTRPKHADGEED